MEMTYNEVQEKLGELYKVVYVMEESIKDIRRCERGTPYAHIPINVLRREINELNSKIRHLEENSVVTYNYDTGDIDKLLIKEEN